MGMSISFASRSGGYSMKHNNREFSQEEWVLYRNANVNLSRSGSNQILVKRSIEEIYHEQFDEPVMKYNAKQKRKDRKIDDYYKKVRQSKNKEIQREIIVQFGTVDDYREKKRWQLANEMLKEYVDGFQKRNPHMVIYNAVIHNDESSPHLHLNYVPVGEGYKRGMEKQVSMQKALENQGFKKQKDSRIQFNQWRDQEVEVLENILNERGIEREIVGTNKFHSQHEYKKYQRDLDAIKAETKKEFEDYLALEKESKKLKEKNEELEEKNKNLKIIADQQNKILKQEKNKLLDAYDPLKTVDQVNFFYEQKRGERTGRLIADGQDVIKARQQAKLEKMIISNLQSTNEGLRKKVESLEVEKGVLEKERDGFEIKWKAEKKEKKELERLYDWLSEEISLVSDWLKKNIGNSFEWVADKRREEKEKEEREAIERQEREENWRREATFFYGMDDDEWEL